ncbi:MAG: hypothetical protein ACI30S_05775 [Muribaculaceae bacterium]
METVAMKDEKLQKFYPLLSNFARYCCLVVADGAARLCVKMSSRSKKLK